MISEGFLMLVANCADIIIFIATYKLRKEFNCFFSCAISIIEKKNPRDRKAS